jgi:hypothetical protein
MGGEVIGRGTRRRGHEDAIAYQFLELHFTVQAHLKVCRLIALAQQCHFIKGQGAVLHAVTAGAVHLQRMQHRGMRALDAFYQAIQLMLVHEEAEAAEFHPVKRNTKRTVGMQGTQHEAIAPKGHDDFGIARFHAAVALGKRSAGALGNFGFAGDEG